MKIYSRSIFVSLVVLGLFVSSIVQADSPTAIGSPDRHSVEVSGKVQPVPCTGGRNGFWRRQKQNTC